MYVCVCVHIPVFARVYIIVVGRYYTLYHYNVLVIHRIQLLIFVSFSMFYRSRSRSPPEQRCRLLRFRIRRVWQCHVRQRWQSSGSDFRRCRLRTRVCWSLRTRKSRSSHDGTHKNKLQWNIQCTCCVWRWWCSSIHTHA